MATLHDIARLGRYKTDNNLLIIIKTLENSDPIIL